VSVSLKSADEWREEIRTQREKRRLHRDRMTLVFFALVIVQSALAGYVAITYADPVARGVVVFLEALIVGWWGFRAGETSAS
jgi:hypothetical protein